MHSHPSRFLTARLRDSQRRVLSTLRYAPIALPTGEIVACDPLVFLDDARPFGRRVARGIKTAWLFGVAHRRSNHAAATALAAIALSTSPVASWTPARLAGSRPRGKPAMDGFPVDTGTACLADESHRAELAADPRLADADKALALFERTPVIVKAGRGNVVAFDSGIGDGTYRSWWGDDADGNAAWLVVDFGLIDDWQATFADLAPTRAAIAAAAKQAARSYRLPRKPPAPAGMSGAALARSVNRMLASRKGWAAAATEFATHAPKVATPAAGAVLGELVYEACSKKVEARAATKILAPFFDESWLAAIERHPAGAGAVVLGNIACLYAIAGDAKRAAAFVKRALAQRSPRFTVAYVAKERDFARVRSAAVFQAALAPEPATKRNRS